jgi:hypothetical protein
MLGRSLLDPVGGDRGIRLLSFRRAFVEVAALARRAGAEAFVLSLFHAGSAATRVPASAIESQPMKLTSPCGVCMRTRNQG